MRYAPEDNTLYKVVVQNGYADYLSIWPADHENPAGWNDTGVEGTKEECLAYIHATWEKLRRHNPPEEQSQPRPSSEGNMSEEREDKTIYKVVLNHEEQYSIWPADRENALGWRDAGMAGTKQECLAYIKEVWTDMRPLSLREKMEEQGK